MRCGGDAHAAELARRGSVAAPRRDRGSAPEKLCEFLALSHHPLHRRVGIVETVLTLHRDYGFTGRMIFRLAMPGPRSSLRNCGKR